MKKRFILSGLTVCLLMAGCQGTQKLQQRDAFHAGTVGHSKP